MDMLDRMVGHDAWANGLVVEQCAGLSDEQRAQEFDIGLGTVTATLAHLITTLEYWTAGMEERPSEASDLVNPSVAELAALHEQYQARFTNAVRTARSQDRLNTLFNDFHGYQQSVGGTILHLLYHSAIHRAEIQHMLQRLGIKLELEGDPQEWEWGMRQMQASS